jgi:multidrug efflux system membrane fusion protein
MMRFVSLFAAILLAAGLGWWFVLRHDQGADEAVVAATGAPAEPALAASPSGPAPVPVVAIEVGAEETFDTLTLRGRTEANRHVVVRAETPGRIISDPLRAGTRVEAGALLCQIEPGARAAQLAEAEAALAEAQIEAEAASRLSEKGFTAETTRIGREAVLQRAEAALNLVKLDIERLDIRAPFAGVLESDTAEIGSRLGIGDECATVIDLSTIKVTGFVSEQDVDRLAAGQRVRVRLVSGRVHEGEIGFIGRMADEDTRTYRVEARLPNPERTIRDGMTAELLVELPAERAHRVPQAALTLDDDGRLGVRVAEGGSARFVPVRVLRDDVAGMWVAGLPERATVIVIGQEFVRDGRAVAPTLVGWEDLG